MVWTDLLNVGYILYFFPRNALRTPWGWLAIALMAGLWYGLVVWEKRRYAQQGMAMPWYALWWIGSAVIVLGGVILTAVALNSAMDASLPLGTLAFAVAVALVHVVGSLSTLWGWVALVLMAGSWIGIVTWLKRRSAELGDEVPRYGYCSIGCAAITIWCIVAIYICDVAGVFDAQDFIM